MAMDVGGARGEIKSTINVTPLVNVMLVLLIIMMVIAPLLNQGVQLTLPTAANSADKPDTSDQTVVAVDAQGNFYINMVPVAKSDAAQRLASLAEEKAPRVVYLKGDTDAPYGAIMGMMDALRKAKIDNVALITDRPRNQQGAQ